MIRRERKFYSEEFRERVLTAYYNSNESVDMIARRLRERAVRAVGEAMEERIRELEQQLAKEKMRSTCLDTMIDIAERELKVDIRKKSGAKQSKK